jgi:amino acid transporter
MARERGGSSRGRTSERYDRLDRGALDSLSLPTTTQDGTLTMIGFGIFLLICAALNPNLRVLGGIGVLCIIVGLILAVLGTIGHAVGGRRHYY